MLTIDIAAWGPILFGRDHGSAVRDELISLVDGASDVVLDFKGVEKMSLSFADECFGELVSQLASRPTPPHVRFAGMSPDARASLHFVMRDRREERLSA